MKTWSQEVESTSFLRKYGETHSALYVTPIHRRPTKVQIGRMHKGCRQRERLDRNPLLAVAIMAKQDPSRLYWYVVSFAGQQRGALTPISYTPHDFDLDDVLSQFTVALTDDFSLDSLLLYGSTGGWALDSSWRNKNENRAAVTFLITVTPEHHAVPGA